MKEVEYCTNTALDAALGPDNYVPFDAEAFYAAWFTSRRIGIGSTRGLVTDEIFHWQM